MQSLANDGIKAMAGEAEINIPGNRWHRRHLSLMQLQGQCVEGPVKKELVKACQSACLSVVAPSSIILEPQLLAGFE